MSVKIGYRSIFQLAIPAMIAGIAEPLISSVDTALIGRIPTDTSASIAAISTASLIFLPLVWIVSQFKSSISSITSRALGGNNTHTLQNLISSGFYLNFLIGVLLWALTNIYIEEILLALQAQDKVLDLGIAYYKIRSLGLPFVLMTYYLFGVLRGLQDTTWAMLISIGGGLLNLAGDWIFIFGWGELIPPLGVEGAAWASLLSQLLMFVATVLIFLKHSPYSLRPSFERNIPQFSELLLITGNLAVRTLILNATLILAGRMANTYGDTVMAAHTITWNIWIFTAFLLDGYSNAANALGGKYYGSEDAKSLRTVMRKVLISALISTGVVALMFLLLYRQIGHWFVQDQPVIENFESVFWLSIAMLPFSGIAFSFDGLFKGIGKAKLLRNVLFLATCLGFIPLLYVLQAYVSGLHAIWISLGAWIMLRGLLLAVYYRFWIRKLGTQFASKSV